jgi:DNA-directed RNA polymerase specialized sigma24 family protein
VSDGLTQEDLARLNEALSMIPPEYVAAMWDIYGHGAKIADVAEELGMNPDALRQKLHRFKKDAREALES